MKKKIKISILLALISLALVSNANSQTAPAKDAANTVAKSELESVLSKFTNYRYGTVSIWKFKNDDRDKIRTAIKEYQLAESGDVAISSDVIDKADKKLVSHIEECVRGGINDETCFDDADSKGLPIGSWGDFQKLYEAVRGTIIGQTGIKQVKSAYLVSTRPNKDYRGTIIALIASYDDEDIAINLAGPSAQDIFVPEELKLVTMTDIAEPYLTNLYDLCERRLAQGNMENKNFEAQGIGFKGMFGDITFGKTQSLITNENNISANDIQSVKRISDIQPMDLRIKENELLVSPDLISWRYYERYTYTNDAGESFTDSFAINNSRLPKLGVELKYGIDEINYPSMWSERMTLSALWDRVKLGFILPTNGWSSLTEDAFKIDRKLTHGGFGIAGEMDFPIKVVPKSGIFHVGFGYVFGDAKESEYKNRKLDPETYQTNTMDNDYLIRLNAQFHYTFAMSIDNDYLFRFGIGGTLYTVEKWYNKLIDNTNNPDKDGNEISYEKLNNETIGGISGKLEFMSKNITTPFGATVQYFDEGIGLNAWIQFPVVENTFAIRVDAKGYFKAFADEPRAWETDKGMFIPMARFIVNF